MINYEDLKVADGLVAHNIDKSLTPIANGISIGGNFSTVRCNEWTVSVNEDKNWTVFFKDKKVIYVDYNNESYEFFYTDGIDKEIILDIVTEHGEFKLKGVA